MNNLAPLVASLLISLFFITDSFSQVGIGTTEPTATLDVNGNIRVRDIKSGFNLEAKTIVGLDEDGNFVEVEVDENIILKDNTLRAVETRYRFASTPLLLLDEINNLDLVVLPGEPNDDKKVIRIITTGQDIDLTGIKAGEDGQTLWIFAYSGKVKFKSDDILSLPQNRFLFNGNTVLKQYDMIQLLYDGNLQRWIPMKFY